MSAADRRNADRAKVTRAGDAPAASATDAISAERSPSAATPIAGGVPLIFEESSPGRRGVDQKGAAASEARALAILGDDLCRTTIDGFPELSEPQVMRHFCASRN